ncbi:MAG: carboxypeptidase-like regulatory domain-containing protein, partial [Bacteroidota bacterium]
MAAQTTGGLRGLVVDGSDQSPLNLVQVSLNAAGKRYETFTNNDGFYQINAIPVGAYKLSVSRAGYSTQTLDVKVVADKNTFNRISLKESTVELDDVTVDARKQEKQTKVSTAVVQLNPKSIVTFSIGGEPDLVRALQVMPGVITTGDQGGQLYIRGGAPIQNLVKLDGMILYNPFHSIGFFSVFETDIMQSADVYTAGFGAEYGGRTSSVMDIRTRTGRRDRISGKVATSTYLAKGLLEIPVGRKKDGIAPSSLLVSYKQSLLDKAAPIFYPYVATEYGGLPFQFRDIYSKYTLESNGGNKFNVFGFNFNDAVRFAGNKSISWDSYGYGTDFTVVPAASNTILEGHLAQSAYTITSTELENRPRYS